MNNVFRTSIVALLLALSLIQANQVFGQFREEPIRFSNSPTRKTQPTPVAPQAQTRISPVNPRTPQVDQRTQASPANYRSNRQPTTPAAPAAVTRQPSSAQIQLIKTLNARARAVKQLNAPVTVKIPGAPKIKGSLQVEFPKRMRLKAGVLGVSEMGVDAGSNEQQFWVWSKMALPGSPAALYFANHDQYQNSQARSQIPLEPEQIINALGLVTLDPNGRHYGPFPEGKKHVRLYTIEEVNGARQTRMLLINANTAAVEQTSVYDQNNQLVAYANALKFKNYNQHKISLPQKIEIHVVQPGQADFVMKVDIGSFSVNSLFGDPNQMWAMPDARNVKRVDLGTLGN